MSIATVVASAPAGVSAEVLPQGPVDLKVLVVSSDGSESTLPAIRQALEYLGTPYDLFRAAPAPADPAFDRFADPASGVALTVGDLATSSHGRYNAVILATGSLSYLGLAGYTSALTPAEWTHLWAYQARFGVRQVSWYTYPTGDAGFFPPLGAVDTSATPLPAVFTPAGRDVFSSYVNTATPVTIRNAYAYLAQPLADGLTSPLLTDAGGNALAAVRTYPDGREALSLTFDSNSYLLHNLVLSYGLVNWATRGLFLGSRRVHLSAQVDDVFIANRMWSPTAACGTRVDDPSLPVYRITGDDLGRTQEWQAAKRAQAPTQDLRLSMAFNGAGTTPEHYATYLASNPAAPAQDTLTPQARSSQADFNWISHTYTHANLDLITATETQVELQRNDDVARDLSLTRYTRESLVQPAVSGLSNPAFLAAASSYGVRHVVSDTSRGGSSTNPSPNAGVANALQPDILQIPRRPNNLYFNVSNPAEWLAEDNCLYPVGASGHVDSYPALLEREANVLVGYLVLGDVDPWMFHQPNLRAYDGTHSLLSDLLDLALAKYSSHFTLPILSPTMQELAVKTSRWMAYTTSGAAATATGLPPSPLVSVTAVRPALVPVTGLAGADAELYGGQSTTLVAAGPVTPVPVAPSARLLPATTDFGSVKLGRTSALKTFSLSNDGTVPVTITGITTTSGDFIQTNTCAASIAPGTSCAVKVAFRPTVLGTRTGALQMATNAGLKSAALTGTGTKRAA